MIVSLFLCKILDEIISKNGLPIIVGGSVRDHFLKNEITDYDVEVYGIEKLDTLKIILEKYGTVNFVGVSFDILKLTTKDDEYDFSFPRIENKISECHRGFDITIVHILKIN